ncbi:hypothetical protein [Hydrogenophaga sp. PBL-H3]|uniref:hypothetical protein n=1 Tax=Hydrogenophaga sp. PBL-H3 TaxID=434010 RepID=UPI00131FE8BB|nr:hypothetical protein [Hydrogenophaga sp. PBL-H3]QHE75731.1 hypothetical protein F9Z45_06515 [Hydrogenophaga sp. PBL-H3]QHE80157.1 hypothetical protein F9Z44_06515 [Hydrogenophaga sp. PBL-H3]
MLTDFAKIGLFLEKFLRSDAALIHDVGVAAEVFKPSTVRPQVSPLSCGYAVYKVHVAASQQGTVGGSVVCIPGFLPTMKPQLSQLPLIVGYGRVSS